MGLIVKHLDIVGNKGTTTAEVLFDSGVSESFIRRSVAEQIGAIARLPTPRAFASGGGQGEAQVSECTQLDVHLSGADVFETLFVTDNLGFEVPIRSSAGRLRSTSSVKRRRSIRRRCGSR